MPKSRTSPTRSSKPRKSKSLQSTSPPKNFQTHSPILKVFSYIGYPILLIIYLLIQGITKLTKLNFPKFKYKLKIPRLQFHLPFSWKYFLTFIGLNCAIGGLVFGAATLYDLTISTLPHPSQLQHLNPSQTSFIYDRNGELLYQIYQDENRKHISLDQLPAQVVHAHLAIEDKNFYEHRGISIPDITRAGIHYLKYVHCQYTQDNCRLTLQGGSTITQQLLKNTLLTPERKWVRKIREAILAVWTERYYTKDQILEMYLNQIPYGGTAYGIEAAAHQYFNKSASDLNLAEASLLAGLPAAPSAYSPYGNHPEKALARQQQVLARMLEDGYITHQQFQEASSQQLTYHPPITDIKAPHFVMYVKDLLEQQLGPEAIYHGGLQITTSLDLNLQNELEKMLREEVTQLQNLKVTNGAILVTQPHTGEILAMIGSIDYFNTEKQGNFNATTAFRQPGSSIKPLMYATALSQNIPNAYQQNQPPIGNKIFTVASLIDDKPITYRIAGTSDYKPQNYDGKYHGRVSIRTALASSYNIPAVKTLNDIGITTFLNKAQDLGITTWTEPHRYGLSLTLGGAEVKMTDMAVAYGTFANLGVRQTLNPVLKIEGNSLEYQKKLGLPSPFAEFKNQVLDSRVAFLINHILSDSQARTPAFGRFSKLEIPNHTVAVKTGTTNLMRDNWTIGYTPKYLVTVWVGNFDNTPMSRIASGITGAAPIWNKAMTYLLNDYQPKNLIADNVLGHSNQTVPPEAGFPWQPPMGLIKVGICPRTGTLPCGNCPAKDEWFIKGTEPTRHCVVESPTTPTPSADTLSQNSIPQLNQHDENEEKQKEQKKNERNNRKRNRNNNERDD